MLAARHDCHTGQFVICKRKKQRCEEKTKREGMLLILSSVLLQVTFSPMRIPEGLLAVKNITNISTEAHELTPRYSHYLTLAHNHITPTVAAMYGQLFRSYSCRSAVRTPQFVQRLRGRLEQFIQRQLYNGCEED